MGNTKVDWPHTGPSLVSALVEIEKITLRDWGCYSRAYAIKSLDKISALARAAIKQFEKA